MLTNLKPATLDEIKNKLREYGLSDEEQKILFHLLLVLLDRSGISEAEQPLWAQTLGEKLASQSKLLRLISIQSGELDALKRISMNLTTNLDMKGVLNAIVSEALDLIPNAQRALIFLYKNGQLQFGASLDRNGTENEFESDPRPNGITMSVARLGQPAIIADISRHPLFAGRTPPPSGSIASLPITMNGRVQGVMHLIRQMPGTFSEAEVRLLQLLADQAAIAMMNASMHAALIEQAFQDSLTNLPNRRALDQKLEEEVNRSGRHGHSFAVVMMDMDGFKHINDKYGHDVGDDVLRNMSRFISQNIRSSDFLARYGGDELTMILPETDLTSAVSAVVILREKMNIYTIGMPDGTLRPLKVSGGIAVYPTHGITASAILRAADEALYRAKKHARGKFVVARTIQTTPLNYPDEQQI